MQFLQNPTGDSSSRRFGGLECLQMGIFLAFVGGSVFLYRGQSEPFLDLVNTLFLAASALLGITTVDKFANLKNKKDKK